MVSRTVKWDPLEYQRYAGERLRPALDLLAQVPAEEPRLIADLGCGPGTVTALLRRRWPDAEVLGIDSSSAMLAKAHEEAPGCGFVQADIAAWTPAFPPDVIFSNAALHWAGDHLTLFPRLLALLQRGGVLAVQMPAMHSAPFRTLQYDVAASGPWAARLASVRSAPPILEPRSYWELLGPPCRRLDVWETTYLHALQGEDAVAAWACGSSLRPFLDAMAGEMRESYLRAYRQALRPHYPRFADGTTLLPFRRLFIVATA